MIVLDASSVVELLIPLSLADEVARRIDDDDAQLHAPHLLTVEVLSVLRRRVAAGITTAQDADDAIRRLGELDVDYHDHRLTMRRIWELRHNLTAYDASYVALAEALPATLLTTDGRLARAPGHSASVALVAP